MICPVDILDMKKESYLDYMLPEDERIGLLGCYCKAYGIKYNKELFNEKFKSIKIHSYGFMDKTVQKPNSYLHFFLANLMNIFPPLRTCFGLKKTNIYCFFKKKLY